MEVNFEHEIGDELTTKASRRGMEIKMSQCGRYPVAVDLIITVVERHMTECSGGIQLSYKCRIHSVGHEIRIVLDYVDFNEIELTSDLSTLQPVEKENGS